MGPSYRSGTAKIDIAIEPNINIGFVREYLCLGKLLRSPSERVVSIQTRYRGVALGIAQQNGMFWRDGV